MIMVQRMLKPDDKLIILADFRENKNITNHLKDLGSSVKILPLKVGDYIISDRTVIERKTANDFVNSIIDGRLFEQAKELKENFSKPLMIIEGNKTRNNVNENVIKGALSSIIMNYDISVLMTKDEKDTANMIFRLANKEQNSKKINIGIKGKKKPKQLDKLQVFVLSSFPNVSEVTAVKLLKKFGSIKGVMNASENELMKIEGLGEKKVKGILKIINKKY